MIFNNYIKWLLLALLCGASAGAYAHKVNVFAYVEGDQIYVEGYFSDGTKAKNSEVTVYEGDGRELTKGLTNEEGDFIFPIKDKEALRIVLNAGQGHQAIYEIPTDEISGTPVSQLSDQSTTDSTALSQSGLAESSGGSGKGDTSILSEAMVRKAVAQGVLPLAREISELKERRGFSDIVGGIGLIVGLLGIFAYVKARQQTRNSKSRVDEG